MYAIVSGLALFTAATAQAVVIGSWNSIDDPLLTGSWEESYGPDGAGQPGCVLAAYDMDESQWSLSELYIPDGGGAETSWDGDVATYVTDYVSLDPDYGELKLFEAPGMWGDAVTFFDVLATVTAQVDYADPDNPVYLGGTIEGTGTYDVYTASFYAEVMRTGFDELGHWGDVTYLELTIVPAPGAFVLLAVAGAPRRRRR